MVGRMLHEIPDQLQTEVFGRELHLFDEIDSTNRWLHDRMQELPHGTVAVADYQSAGRGRLKRSWSAPPGTGLLISILLKPNWPVERAGWLMMISGLAASGACSTVSGLEARLKWPNDVVWKPAEQPILYKLGGILSESIFDNGKLSGGILGIGLNVNMTAEQLPPAASTAVKPASLRTLTGEPQNRAALAAELLQRLKRSTSAVSRASHHCRNGKSGWSQ